MNQFKINLIVAAITATTTFVGISIYNHKETNKLTQQLDDLKKNATIIQGQIIEKDKTIKGDQSKIADLKTQFDESSVQLQKQATIIVSMKHIQTIVHATTSNEAITKITKLYNDSTTTFQVGRFSVGEQTTYSMLGDAENWLINGPILQMNVTNYKNGWDAANISLNDCKNLSNSKDVLITDLTGKTVLQNTLITNAFDQRDNLNKQLKIEKSNVKIKFVEGFVGGLAIYYLKDKLKAK